MNKCEELKIEHAWRETSKIYGFSITFSETCANCNLVRNKCSDIKEYYSYSDGRPNEPIINIRPV